MVFDFIFSCLLLRNLLKYIFQFDVVALTSVFFLTYVILTSTLKSKYAFVSTRLLVVLSLITLALCIGIKDRLLESSILIRLSYNYITIFLSVLAAYMYSKKIDLEQRFSLKITDSICFGLLLIALVGPTVVTADMFNSVSMGVAFRGFSNENGILASLLTLIVLYKSLSRKFTIYQKIIYTILLMLTKSSLSIVPIVYIWFYRKIDSLFKSKKNNITTSQVVLTIFVISVFAASATLEIFSLSEKVSLLFKGGGASDLGGRYLANSLVVQQLITDFNTPNLPSLLFGHGITGYQLTLSNYLDNLQLPSSLKMMISSYDHGGSDVLMIIHEFGFLSLFALFIIVRHFSMSKYFGSNESIQVQTRLILLIPLVIKGVGIFSPFFFFVFLSSFAL